MDSNVLIHKLQRDLNCLSDPDRSTRRRALERLQKRLLSGDPGEAAPPPSILQVAWDDVILRLVARNLSDPIEKCRELALHLISSVVKVIQEVDQTMQNFLPIMAERLGQTPVLEESEEIRLQLVNLLASALLPRCPADVCLKMRDSFFKIIMASVGDQFHEVKKGACQIIVVISDRAPKTLGEKTEPLLKALLLNISHSHVRVRTASLQAVDAIVQIGLPAGAVSECLAPGVKPLAFDRSTGLRALFFTSLAQWLGWNDDNLKDKKTSSHQEGDLRVTIPDLLPLLLLGITDESKSVAANSLRLVEGVGCVYEQYVLLSGPSPDKVMLDAVEEMSLEGSKSDQDALTNESMVSPQDEFVLPAPYRGRPSIGSRKMVQAFLGKLLGPILKDLHGWTVAGRLGAARLALTLLILAEENALEHLDILIPSFSSAVGDEEVAIAQHIITAVHVLGFHTKSEYWVPLILDIVISPRSNDVQRANGLVVMAGLLFGTPMHAIQERLVKQLNDGLCEEDVRCSDHPAIRRQLLAVMTNLLRVAEGLCKSSSLQMFLILLQLQSAEGDVPLQQSASQLVVTLAKAVGLRSVQDLYLLHMDQLIPFVTAGYKEWSGSSPVKALFQTFMKDSGNTVGPHLGVIIKMFNDCLHEDRDPALRISLLQLLDELLENNQLGCWWTPLADQVVLGILIPCGVWRMGKVGASIRHKTMVALGTFLRRNLCSQGQLMELLQSEKGMLGVIISCLDEDYYVDTRRVSCHVMQHLIRIAGPSMEDNQRSTVSTEIQKRVEDSSDAVRMGILPAIATFFQTMPESYADEEVRSFLSNLLVHMDDPNAVIQDAVCIAVEACATRRPKLVIELAQTFRNRHQATSHCDQLIAFATSIT